MTLSCKPSSAVISEICAPYNVVGYGDLAAAAHGHEEPTNFGPEEFHHSYR